MAYCLIVDDNTVKTTNYWCSERKGMFFYVDLSGYLLVFICKKMNVPSSLRLTVNPLSGWGISAPHGIMIHRKPTRQTWFMHTTTLYRCLKSVWRWCNAQTVCEHVCLIPFAHNGIVSVRFSLEVEWFHSYLCPTDTHIHTHTNTYSYRRVFVITHVRIQEWKRHLAI